MDFNTQRVHCALGDHLPGVSKLFEPDQTINFIHCLREFYGYKFHEAKRYAMRESETSFKLVTKLLGMSFTTVGIFNDDDILHEVINIESENWEPDYTIW
jgi:hypothetical protein